MPVDAAAGHPVRPNAAQRVVLGAIRGYQLLFSSIYSGSCRFLPSCSAYAFEAVERHGVLRGGALAIRRLMRCHPLGGHGHDPVPAFAPPELRRGKPSDSQIQ
jgi:putative membrane protein insertion efficiency factor